MQNTHLGGGGGGGVDLKRPYICFEQTIDSHHLCSLTGERQKEAEVKPEPSNNISRQKSSRPGEEPV